MPTNKKEDRSRKRKKRLMVIMAHADDMEFYAGGTVAKFADQGYEIILVMMTANICGADLDGDGNYLQHPPENVIPVREAETHAGAEILGADTILQVGFKDSIYFDGRRLVTIGDSRYDVHHESGSEPIVAAPANMKCIERVQRIVEKYEPQIVITHNLTSGFEHTCVAQMANQAFSQAVRDGAKLGQLWMPTQVRHGAWESDIRMFASPNILIDVTDYWTTKLKAIRAHRSQLVESSIKKVEVIGRYWGIVRQCRYAEPFFTIYDATYR